MRQHERRGRPRSVEFAQRKQEFPQRILAAEDDARTTRIPPWEEVVEIQAGMLEPVSQNKVGDDHHRQSDPRDARRPAVFHDAARSSKPSPGAIAAARTARADSP